MTDTDKQTVDQPAADEPKVDEPKADEPKADEPKADEPKADESKVGQDAAASTSAPADSGAQAVSTDQHGRQLFEVDCSSCGNKAQVPFKPSGGRPVYCRDCYMKQRNDQGSRRQF